MALALGMALLSACNTLPPAMESAPATALVPLIPVRDFVASRDSVYGHKISPDGRKLAWIGVQGVSPHIFVKDLERDFTQVLSVGFWPGGFSWAPDNRHLLFNFHAGNEDGGIYRLDTLAGDENQKIQPILAERGVSAVNVGLLVDEPEHMLVAHNRRDKAVPDLYKVHWLTGRQSLVEQNPGNVKFWVMDRRGRPAGRVVKEGDHIALLLNGAAAPVYAWSTEDDVEFAGFSGKGDRFFLLSNKGRDRVAVLEIDASTGAEKVVHADGRVDVSAVMLHPVSGEPLVAYTQPDYPQATRLSAAAPDFSGLAQGRAHVGIANFDRAFRRFVVVRATDKGQAYFLHDTDTGHSTPMGTSPSLSFEKLLADVRPVSFTSRDHVALHGYLTLPVNGEGKPHPMVLLVHGGPWARDSWGYNPEVQFLANRGYAVLQVNYRGSSGYGREFQELAVGEFAGKMQDDLLDAVRWAVEQGHADPSRIAISGGSYGGYAALVGLTSTPETFACGMDLSGPSDLVRLMEDFPASWKLEMDSWRRYVGNPAEAADRETMHAKSPLFQTERIVRPLMVVQGGQDVRVRPYQSSELVEKLRQQNKPVEFLQFPAEGHGVAHWPNRLRLLRRTESFLAKCLRGRDNGVDYYELGAWLF